MNITHPALVPSLWSFLITILSVLLVIKVLRTQGTDREESFQLNSVYIKFTLKAIFSLIIYLVLVTYFGYLLSTVFFIIAIMYILNYRKVPVMIIISTSFCIFTYLIFNLLLKIDLPRGMFFS